MIRPLDQCVLYTFIDIACLRGRDVAEVCKQLCDGGSDLVQLRAKNCPMDEVRRFAERIQPIIRRSGACLVINDYPQLASEVGAPYCHLGQEDFSAFRHVGEVPGAKSLNIGLSSHSPDQAERAIKAGAAYIAVGPVYATPTKPTATPVGLEYVRWASKQVPIPWFAIGGINLERLEAVLEAGARRVCVVSAILNAPNIREACQTFKERLISARQTERKP